MSWVLEHLNVILLVGGAIAYWLNQRRRERAGQDADYDGDGVPDGPTGRRVIDPDQPDPEEAERARRIQEEIRRKIAARRGPATPPARLPDVSARPLAHRGPTPDPVSAPRPAMTNPLEEMLRRFADPREDEAARARAAAAEQATRDRQRQLEVQLQDLEARQKVEAQRAAVVKQATSEPGRQPPRSRTARQSSLLQDLRSAHSLRRAIVLREVFGPPQSLK